LLMLLMGFLRLGAAILTETGPELMQCKVNDMHHAM
jgi:hypothetical protein